MKLVGVTQQATTSSFLHRRPAADTRRPARISSPAKAAPWAASTRCAARRWTAWSDARELLSGRRLRLARAARREPAAPARAGARRRAPRAPRAGQRDPRRAGALAPRRRAAPRAARRAGQVREPQPPAARRIRPRSYDWLLVVDDDIVLPRGFLDRLLFLAERFALRPGPAGAPRALPRRLARSRAAAPAAVARETPLRGDRPGHRLRPRAPSPRCCRSPTLRMGWGLDLHWAALARERGWRCGVLDAVAIAPRRRARRRAPTRASRPSPRRARSSPSDPT